MNSVNNLAEVMIAREVNLYSYMYRYIFIFIQLSLCYITLTNLYNLQHDLISSFSNIDVIIKKSQLNLSFRPKKKSFVIQNLRKHSFCRGIQRKLRKVKHGSTRIQVHISLSPPPLSLSLSLSLKKKQLRKFIFIHILIHS